MSILLIALVFVALAFSLLYARERFRRKKYTHDLAHLCTQLTELAKCEENHPLLVQTEDAALRDVVRAANDLLARYEAQSVYHRRREKALLELSTNLSHDLRTPVTVLAGTIEMLDLESRRTPLPENVQANLKKARQSGQALVKTVDQRFDLAKLASGDMLLAPQPTDLMALCHEVLLSRFDVLEQAGFTVEAPESDTPAMATVDPEATKRILANLIDNVLHHAATGRYLALRLTEEATTVIVTVHDHGPGIAANDLPHIFSRTVTTDRRQGSGLGLTIASELANAMGGSLTAENTPDGASFHLRLKK